MKYLLILTLTLCTPLLVNAVEKSNSAVSSASDKATITQLERDSIVALARMDAAKLLTLGLPDAWFIDSSGAAGTLKSFAADVKSGTYAIQSMHLDDLKVRMFGDAAVALGLETEKSHYKGKDTSGQYRFTDTWLKRDGRWLCVASAATALTPPKH